MSSGGDETPSQDPVVLGDATTEVHEVIETDSESPEEESTAAIHSPRNGSMANTKTDQIITKAPLKSDAPHDLNSSVSSFIPYRTIECRVLRLCPLCVCVCVCV